MNEQLTIQAGVMNAVNFAMQQNYVPLIRNITLKNMTDAPLEALKLKITFDPAFAGEYTCNIDRIEAKGSLEISPVKIQLSTEYFFGLSERIDGHLTISVYKDGEEEAISTLSPQTALLACDQWSGINIMPELICAFVTPNHPKIAALLNKAADFLKSWNESPSFTAYQTQNVNTVKRQMAAIYAAVRSLSINYVVPPASFENAGQRVRLAHTVIDHRQGTCLDLTLLYASCLEAAGLRPLLVITRGHAFAGCWLEEESFADCAIDDVSALTKRTAEGAEEILLIEMTDAVDGKDVDFDKAVAHGKNKLGNIDDFECVIDVLRCRNSGVRPIPEKLEDAKEPYASASAAEPGMVAAPSELVQNLKGSFKEGEVTIGKLQMWERKLLDFSLRNSLLNFRVTKNTIQLMAVDLPALEDGLADNSEYSILELPSEFKNSLRDEKMYAIDNQKDMFEAMAAEELRNHRIRTFLSEDKLAVSLKSIQRAAKLSLEENGANTLFLAIGFLRWYETDLSEKPRYAPLVLLPVEVVKSVRKKGYVLRSRNEETQINVTLLEYLRQDHGLAIGGLDPLPEDEHGIDLPLVFHTIRQAVMDKKKWNVENMAFLGLFSFGQFVMWNDLRNRTDDLKKNKVVNSLLEGHMTWEAEDLGISAEHMDEQYKPEDMAVPLSVDSSQMVAVATAAKGQSFVLHGPPGTGKSQTITNMIANALYQGKSVLFVAEKMAALSVVQNRLAKIGLDPFCLELHSNKSNKTAVLGQLEKTLEVGRLKHAEEYADAAKKLLELRTELGHVIDAVHKKRSFGRSLYELISEYESFKSSQGRVKLPENSFSAAAVSAEQISRWQEVLREYETTASAIVDLKDHPLKGINASEYTMEKRDRLQSEWSRLSLGATEAANAFSQIKTALSIDIPADRKGIEKLFRICDFLKNDGVYPAELVQSQTYEALLGQIRQYLSLLSQLRSEYNELSAMFLPQAFMPSGGFAAGAALIRYKTAEGSWFIPKAMGISKAVKELKAYAQNGTVVDKNNIGALLERLSAFEQLRMNVNSAPPAVTSALCGLYNGENSDIAAIEKALDKAQAAVSLKAELGASVFAAFSTAAASGVRAPEAEYNCLKKFINDTDAAEAAEHIDPINGNTDWIAAVKDRFERYSENTHRLREWTGYQRLKQQAVSLGLECVCCEVEKGSLPATEAEDAFFCALDYRLVSELIAADPKLADFRGVQYEGLIERYTQKLNEFRKLTVQELVAKLSANIPSGGGEAAASSELGILKKAIKSNGRMMSIRKLFDQIPTLLRKLCPCMLMSPISVAQYIDPLFPKFDLVVFDEASQLPTSEAVGTIARGENVVIVGDPKQLPPTSFFKSNKEDEDNSEQEDLESLLDDCLAISMPQEYLKWHYRSRHESLIAYSNMKYYDNKLYTFPSPNDSVSQVRLVHVDGVYDHGKTRVNRAEAEAVVNEVIRRLRDPKLKKDSIGVVTFSVVQQNLIEDMLSDEFAKNPELDEYVRSCAEPIFVKNLENVQGDERDVILFSVCYGPDANGKVSMNFGPLNRDGGWRRLNVAISRARKEMTVFAVLRPEQIDLNRTASEGVAGLKGFLEFAQHGQGMIAGREGLSVVRDDELVKDIAAAISKEGYETRTNIGCSAYRMDIGIVDPDDPGNYLLGLILDGENMKASATVDDRFAVQPSVLGGLGWKLLRIWTLEWLDDPAPVIQRIKEAAEQAKAAKAEEAAAEEEGLKEEAEKIQEETQPEDDKDHVNIAGFTFERDEEAIAASEHRSEYVHAIALNAGSAEQFDVQNARSIAKTILRFLNIEAPISRRLLMKKCLNDWGVSRTTPRVEQAFETASRFVPCNVITEHDMAFYWGAEQKPDEYDKYRVEAKENTMRGMEDIPSQEIKVAMTDILQQQVSVSREDLLKLSAKAFGFQRLGPSMEAVLNYALDDGIEKGLFSESDDGKVSMGNNL